MYIPACARHLRLHLVERPYMRLYYRSDLRYKIVAHVKDGSSLNPSTPLKDSVKIGEIGHLNDITF